MTFGPTAARHDGTKAPPPRTTVPRLVLLVQQRGVGHSHPGEALSDVTVTNQLLMLMTFHHRGDAANPSLWSKTVRDHTEAGSLGQSRTVGVDCS